MNNEAENEVKASEFEDDYVAVQVYKLKLIDGSSVQVREEYDLPSEKGIVYKFAHSEENELFEIHNSNLEVTYLPKRSIVSISTYCVEKIDKKIWQMSKMSLKA